MKKSDLGSLILLVAISFTVAYLIGNAIFNSPQNYSTQVEVITPIDRDFPEISSAIFNDQSLNPTADIQIGGQPGSTTPFGGN